MVKTPETDGYLALQVGAVNVAQRKITKNLVGHFSSKGVDPKRRLVEFKVSEDAVLPVGNILFLSYLFSTDLSLFLLSKRKIFLRKLLLKMLLPCFYHKPNTAKDPPKLGSCFSFDLST